jgi:hypothetical protein
MRVKSIPSVVQLPGGVRLHGLLFVCVDYNEDGSPKTFELQAADLPKPPGKRDEWVLFAHEEQIRAPGRKDKFR